MGVEIVGGILIIVVLSALAFVAITEREISVGTRHGAASHASGSNAVWLGVGYIGISLFVLGYLLRFAAHKATYWSLLALAWAALVVWQVTIGL
jgi:hypothetical protein